MITLNHLNLVGKGPSTAVNDWFAKRGLTVVRMRKGLLISGSKTLFEKVLIVEQIWPIRPLELPVLDELSDYVDGINIPKRLTS